MTIASTTLDVADRSLSSDLLDRDVTGFGVAAPATLRSVLNGSSSSDDPSSDGLALLVFLRHFG